jgi:4-amino-4-deoxy-L-arabinose transferase-like glycosyltransferase
MTTTAPALNTAPAISTVTSDASPGDLAPGDIGPGRIKRLVRGRPTDPAWVRPSLFALLIGTAFLYIWGLGASGWANSFYSAAVQAGSKSWKAFFFGSSDASNFITVDKPPASLWVMEISARIFGVNAWSILVPQALEGVATVAVLYATVRRWFTPAAGLLAGAVLALTPVAVLMFRFNNPDALLVLLVTIAAYAVTRALEAASTRWLLLAGSLVGLGFLAKMMQAFFVVPAFGLVYLLAAPTSFWRRVWQLLLAGVAMFVAAAWWVVAVTLTPASARPYIGGSQHNSILELIFGYNGFGRLTGNETGSVTGGGAGTTGGRTGGGSMWGPTGITRLFGSEMGTQISWLIPAALIAMLGALWLSRREGRTSKLRAATVLWGTTLIVSGLILSLSKGIIHPYYTVALAPAIGALVGIGGTELWRHRQHWTSRFFLSVAIAVTTWWAHVLLGRTSSFESWLRPAVLVVGIAAAVAVLVVGYMKRGIAVAIAGAAVLTAVGAPVAFALDTASTPHTGSIPTAGPSSGQGGPGGFGGGGFGGGGFGGGRGGQPGGTTGGQRTGGFGTPPTGTAGGTPPTGTTGTTGATGVTGTTGTAGTAGPGGTGGFGGGRGQGGGGLLSSSTPSAALTAALKANASKYTWVAAAIGSNDASGYQLATGDPVMAIGGFNGSDPAPTLAQFEKFVAEGKIHYFIAGSVGTPNGGSNASSEISSWVSSHYTAVTIGGVTLYDLTKATS